MLRSAYARAIEAALHGAALPYGYTLTIWGSGEALSHVRGRPSLWDIGLFVAGAAVAYAVLRWTTRGAKPTVAATALGADPHLLRAGALQAGAIALAIASAAVLGRIPTGVAWPAGSFAATALYLLGTAVDLALRAREQS
jgi:hypothetical protein